MVPRKPEENGVQEYQMSSDSGEDEFSSATSALEPTDDASNQHHDLEEEYHTEDSDGEDLDEDESGSAHDLTERTAPLLPKELLKPLPSPEYSLQQTVNIPREEMTRQQKVAQRNRSRKAKKRVWEALRRDSRGTGVLEAGRAAQLKRGLLRSERVKSGRVAKKTQPTTLMSGRQQLLEQRKTAVRQSKKKLLSSSKKSRRRRVRPVSTG